MAAAFFYCSAVRYRLLPVLALAACATSTSKVPDPLIVSTAGGRLAARLVAEPHDPEQHQATSKVFHHVYAPDGRRLTKGVGGQFGHHRGLFLGWNQLQCRGERYDFWHCNKGEVQELVSRIDNTATRRDNWQASCIEWRRSNAVIASEVRRLRAREHAADVTILDFESELTFIADTKLAGDPQHAGQQFRALQMFAEKDGPKVDYLRPATATEHGNDVWRNCKWIAAVLPLRTGDVTVLRLEGADNPTPTTWSTRPYGRFGATFTHTVKARTPLRLSWTYAIAVGRRDAAWCQSVVTALSSDGRE